MSLFLELDIVFSFIGMWMYISYLDGQGLKVHLFLLFEFILLAFVNIIICLTHVVSPCSWLSPLL